VVGVMQVWYVFAFYNRFVIAVVVLWVCWDFCVGGRLWCGLLVAYFGVLLIVVF